MIKNISNLGDAAVYCDFGSEVNQEINQIVISYFNTIRKTIDRENIKGILNLTPSYNKLIVSFDLSLTNFSKVKKVIQNVKIDSQKNILSNKIKIPVCIDEEFSFDFKRITKITSKPKEKFLEIFFQKEYFCYMTGFIAGMPFLGDVEKKIRCERLETPRVKVPKGSVGITEQFANIYTFESPGGWNIIGKTPKQIFIKSNLKDPALIKPGDKVIFYQISKKEYLNWND